ncbi:MAG: RsmD family RNA methyltransferase [Bacillus sp. (in: Bacteria)]|nr:RsmD family RNA methyltransferase [Bacillus sp. (in: firmicutes)]
MRSFFQFHSDSKIVISSIPIDPSRSPFIKYRLDIMVEGKSLQEIIEQVPLLSVKESETYKIVFLKNPDLSNLEQPSLKERQEATRKIAEKLKGIPDLHKPDVSYGLLYTKGKWWFGLLIESKPIWHYHQKKPRNYSTALNTRLARAVVNIAVPIVNGVKVIDPCCGIGTVLIEALSMGIDITGSDINPLAVIGARENIVYFGYQDIVHIPIKDMRQINKRYDTAIVDMPYNLCSVLSVDEKLEIIKAAGRMANKIVFITVEKLDEHIKEANLSIVDRCTVKKGSHFQREVIVCYVLEEN